MTEMELKLTLLRYNVLSREESAAASKYMRAGETADYEDKWFKCINEMAKMEDDLREYGYKFVYNGIKAAGSISYSVYKIVPIDHH